MCYCETRNDPDTKLSELAVASPYTLRLKFTCLHASIAYLFGSTLCCVNVFCFLLVLVVGCAVVCCCMTAWAWEWLREGGERGVRRRYGLRFVVAVDDVIRVTVQCFQYPLSCGVLRATCRRSSLLATCPKWQNQTTEQVWRKNAKRAA